MVLGHQLQSFTKEEMLKKKKKQLHRPFATLGTQNWHEPFKIHIGRPLGPQYVKLEPATFGTQALVSTEYASSTAQNGGKQSTAGW